MEECSRDETSELIDRASRGDPVARQLLLSLHRARLRLMVLGRLDRRLAARLDPSDVVQDALIEASCNLDGYFRDRPLPFYPWLRRIACERVAKLHRHHLGAQRRSVAREEHGHEARRDRPDAALVEQLIASGTSPSLHLMRDELRRHLRDALGKLSATDREILSMRHLEQMETTEIAASLAISEGAVRVRHLRAVQRLRDLLEESP
jgi:RNA polymerase sigma-70 factor, ECF subfamily